MTAKTNVRQRNVHIQKGIEKKIDHLQDRTDLLTEKTNFLIGCVNKAAEKSKKWVKNHIYGIDTVGSMVLGSAIVIGMGYGMYRMMGAGWNKNEKSTPVEEYAAEESDKDGGNQPTPVNPKTPMITLNGWDFNKSLFAENKKGGER